MADEGASTKVKIAKIGSGIIGAALLIAIPFVSDHEGESLTSYRDVAGVWTICNGETLGVKPGQVKTKDECSQLTQSRVGQFMRIVASLIHVRVSPEILAAHTSFAYNVGIRGYARSMTLKDTNKGAIAAGCKAMINWVFVDKKDCRIRANNCFGLVERRNGEIKLCLSGVGK